MTDKGSSTNVQKSGSTTYDAGNAKSADKVPARDVMPTGVLAMHIKRCKALKVQDGSKAFSKRLPVSLYFKMMVGEIVKITSVNDVRCSNDVGVMIDDLKHFLVVINNKLDDDSNKVRLMLMGFQGNNKHKKLGEKEIHLFNIIRNLFIVETLELAKNAHVMGEVDVEMAFSYGCFGYGYSSQLESKTHTPAEQISQSLFFRAEPPFDRVHDTRDVMTAIPVPHPPFIDWSVQVDMAMSNRDYMTSSIADLMAGKDKGTAEYPLLKQHMKRLPGMQRRYSSLTKRSQRLMFLQSLVTSKISPELEENHDEFLFAKDVTVKQLSADVLEHGLDDHTYYEEENSPGLLYRLASAFGFAKKKTENLEGGADKTAGTEDHLSPSKKL
ncbi:cation channel sperm-associated targeting subunit tau-like [Watersipora subatra]|uniref:cation channel sperm-associated targeting subunit tau-like n=1 Tax=Watersipora subatra TaxID=2589382 RepID=UPI00355C7102